MSTATMTMSLPPTTKMAAASAAATDYCCPNCGLSLPPPSTSDSHTAALLQQAQRQIEDLQSQVRLLNQKATAAVDRWADYEDELSRLRAASTSTTASTKHNTATTTTPNNNRPHTPDPSVSTGSPRSSFLGAGATSRISRLLSPRKSPSSSHTTTTTPHQQKGSLSSSALPLPLENGTSNAAETRELLAALTQERRLRVAAEEKLAATDREVEDLSASLFEQANAMVADERRARAKLEERVDVLGRRDQEKRARIGRLEGAVRRIERARGVLEGRELDEETESDRNQGEEEGEEEEEDQDGEKGEENGKRRDTVSTRGSGRDSRHLVKAGGSTKEEG
ncbi:hypothetical protein F5Y10DRAFT_233996 [Nemania abortiva]|nr:hypothetical protein F5Y10DRAFT_233996 [Nemania abortiva]